MIFIYVWFSLFFSPVVFLSCLFIASPLPLHCCLRHNPWVRASASGCVNDLHPTLHHQHTFYILEWQHCLLMRVSFGYLSFEYNISLLLFPFFLPFSPIFATLPLNLFPYMSPCDDTFYKILTPPLFQSHLPSSSHTLHPFILHTIHYFLTCSVWVLHSPRRCWVR